MEQHTHSQNAREHPSPHGYPLLQWSATEHPVHRRTKLWYAIAGILIAGCIVYSVLTSAWSFTAITVLTAAFYFVTHRFEQTKRNIVISEKGFTLDGSSRDWSLCAGFWILRGRNFAELHIELKNPPKTEVKIQTGNTDPGRIHQAIRPFLTEYPDRNEHILDTISRICKL